MLELACRQLFDRAVDEPERIGLYAAVCKTMCEMVVMQKEFTQGVSGYDLIRNCMTQHFQEVLQQTNLSWGNRLRNSLWEAIPNPVGEQYYTAEKQKRRGIGLAGLAVELSRLNLFQNYQEYALLQELAKNMRIDPREGDVVSLCILSHCRGSSCRSISTEISWDLRELRKGPTSPRLKCWVRVGLHSI